LHRSSTAGFHQRDQKVEAAIVGHMALEPVHDRLSLGDRRIAVDEIDLG
jgi:hypothetical protein